MDHPLFYFMFGYLFLAFKVFLFYWYFFLPAYMMTLKQTYNDGYRQGLHGKRALDTTFENGRAPGHDS